MIAIILLPNVLQGDVFRPYFATSHASFHFFDGKIAIAVVVPLFE